MQFSIACLFATGAHAATVLVTKVSGQRVEGGSVLSQVWSVDTRIGNSQLIADNISVPLTWAPPQAGVVCGNVYYTVTKQGWVGMNALDLASGESRSFGTTLMFEELTCDPKDASKLLGVAFTSDGAALASYDTVMHTEAVVGTFTKPTSFTPTDVPDIISFTQDGSEVWVAWQRDSCLHCADAKKGGHVHIMDTSSGKIKTSSDISFTGEEGTPYFLLPDAKRGVFVTKCGGFVEMKWADLEVTEGSMKAKIGNTDVSGSLGTLEDSGMLRARITHQMCGSNLLAFSKDWSSPYLELSEISPADGVVVFPTLNLHTMVDYDYESQTDISALACLKPTWDLALV